MALNLRKGICLLKCQEGHTHGVVYLTEVKSKGAVKFQVYIRDVSPGLHGFHIHRLGNELSGPSSLCDHFNPTHQNHGNINTTASHVGDLGNIYAYPIKINESVSTGIIDTELIAKRVRLSGPQSVFGRSLVVHENEDDLGKGGYPDSLTTGHSGKRILWGIIAVNDDSQC